MRDQPTVVEKILQSALDLDEEKGTFTAEDLVVRCWQRFPQTFGLQGYAGKYPDSNRVLTKIMGGSALRGKGWLRKVGEKRYRVTEVGKRAMAQKGGIGGEKTERRAALERVTVEILNRLLSSRAFQKFRLGEELTFGDLSSFWNVSPRSNAYQLNVGVKEADAALAAAEDFLKSAELESLVLPGRSVHITKVDLRMARALHEHLKEAFAREMNVILGRSDERLSR
jgi:hypothetical protein